MELALPDIPIFRAIASSKPHQTAIIESSSRRRFTYGELLQDVAKAKEKLLNVCKEIGLEGQRVAMLVENGYEYVVTLLSIFACHCVAVPLALEFPINELVYNMNNSGALFIIGTSKYKEKIANLCNSELKTQPTVIIIDKIRKVIIDGEPVKLQEAKSNQGGMILYTSGSTSQPKGVVLTLSALTAQSISILEAWKYSSKDHILNVMPLHHIHGITTVLITPLFSGSAVEFLYPFDPQSVFERLGAPFLPSGVNNEKITIFTGVPTMYNLFLSLHPTLPISLKAATREALSPKFMRLTLSGAASLPAPVKAAWTDLTNGNAILDRFGMTETGMALSCGIELHNRIDGSIGWPLPSVEVRLVDMETNEVIEPSRGNDTNEVERQGEIQLRGPTIFKGYWNNPAATQQAFVESKDGQGSWFRTGDIAIRKPVKGTGTGGHGWANGPVYFVQGRNSVDIINRGGEKVSALEVERELLSLPQVADVVVIGLPSEAWGQKVAAVVVLAPNISMSEKTGESHQWGLKDMRRALKDKLATHKIPTSLKIVEKIPRNVIGKINKKIIAEQIFPEKQLAI